MRRESKLALTGIVLFALAISPAPARAAAVQAAQESGGPGEAAGAAKVQDDSQPKPFTLTALKEYPEIQLGTLVRFKVNNLEGLLTDGVQCDDLLLFLDGFALKGVAPVSCSRPQGEVGFLVKRTDENKAAWDVLLGKPTQFTRPVHVSLGVNAETPVDSQLKMPLVVIPRFEFWVFVILFAVGLLLFYWRGTDLLRNSYATSVGGKPKAFSLSRFQMAIWFGLVIVSYALIWLITGELNSITESALVLIGLGSVTGLGSAVVDSGRRQTLDDMQSLKAAREKEAGVLAGGLDAADAAAKPDLVKKKADAEAEAAKLAQQIQNQFAELNAPSSGFLADVLRSQGASQGVGLDRFQMLCWNVILGAIFVFSVFHDLSMPDFSPTLLALMGVSSGTYLGFKLRPAAVPSPGTAPPAPDPQP